MPKQYCTAFLYSANTVFKNISHPIQDFSVVQRCIGESLSAAAQETCHTDNVPVHRADSNRCKGGNQRSSSEESRLKSSPLWAVQQQNKPYALHCSELTVKLTAGYCKYCEGGWRIEMTTDIFFKKPVVRCNSESTRTTKPLGW